MRLSVVARVTRVQIGPVQRELQLTHLSRAPVPHGRLSRSQRLGSVEVLDGDEGGGVGHDSIEHSPPTVDLDLRDTIHSALVGGPVAAYLDRHGKVNEPGR